MKKILYIAALFCSLVLGAQTAIHNIGGMQIHANANVGVHTHFINNGFCENNLGTVGFYSSNRALTLSGNKRPVFYNVDVATVNATLNLENALGITNDLNFVEGKVITPRSNNNISLDLIRHDFVGGANNDRHVDGYASVKSYGEAFTFPIGNDDRLRPMILPENDGSKYFKGAYYFENPNLQTTFSTNFDDTQKDNSITVISNLEFWDLDGKTATEITLTWDDQSNIPFFVQKLKNLIVVGWHKTNKKWENLGNTNTTGTSSNGTITSTLFTPDNYEIITIGSKETIETIECNANYLISPNGDDVGDALVIDCLERIDTQSVLSVYNRWGNLVFKGTNQNGKWKGVASTARATLYKENRLPTGTYFYFVNYGKNLRKRLKGWVYVGQ